MFRRYDFHSHTHFSDGVLSPTELVERAENKQVELLAISDHDTISGLKEAQLAIEEKQLKVKLVNSIELSAQSDFGEIHIVGLNIDPANKTLLQAIEKQQKARWDRAQAISDKFEALGITGVFEYLKANCQQVVTRSHIARSLVELKIVKDAPQAFKKYLGSKGRVKVKANWMAMESAIGLIQQAGGMAILAHPTRYPMSNKRLTLLIDDFKLSGGDAMEISYPSLSPDKKAWLNQLRGQHDLLASGGSDFHYPDLKWSDLGKFNPIDKDTPHVLQHIK